jgi:aminobenzoyl-glutamate utilization protein B
MKTDEIRKFVCAWIESRKEDFHRIADEIWEFSEVGMEEYRSSARLAEVLKRSGFAVEEGAAGMPTAFVASAGAGRPVLGFSAEYDCLPGLSQDLGCEKRARIEGGPGHGCGHNLLGTGALAAILALKEAQERFQFEGTFKLFGTPAEELCIGKPFLARAGYFRGVDAFLDWHPWGHNRADYDTCIAYFNLKYHFKGKTCHGNAPWRGRSSLDAAMLMGHALEFLREHVSPGCEEAATTLNYTFPDVGPLAPNVVPDRATLWCIGRVRTAEEMATVMERVQRCGEGAAIATETEVRREFITATHDKIPNKVLAEILHRNLRELGPPRFTEEEQEFVRKIQGNTGLERTGITEEILPFGGGFSALCDTSEYSWFAPYATAWIAIAPQNFPWHNWVVTASAGSSIGKKAMDTAARLLAVSAVDLIRDPGILAAAQGEWQERLSVRPSYASLLPESAKPLLPAHSPPLKKDS